MNYTGFVYVCSGGETFDSIARELWSDENKAAELMCANPEYAGKQMFTGKEIIYIPEIETAANDGNVEAASMPTKAPWR